MPRGWCDEIDPADVIDPDVEPVEHDGPREVTITLEPDLRRRLAAAGETAGVSLPNVIVAACRHSLPHIEAAAHHRACGIY